MKAYTAAIALVALLAFSGAQAQTSFPSVPAAIQGLGLTGLQSLITAANLTDALSSPDLTVTLFAPSNDAVAATLTYLNTQNVSVSSIAAPVLLYHAVPNVSINLPSAAGFPGLVLPTLLASQNLANTTTSVNVRINANGTYYVGGVIDGALFNGSQKITAGKSEIYIIDSVIIPPSSIFSTPLTLNALIASNGNFSILGQIIAASPDLTALANNPTLSVTVFAPTNAAFQALLASNPNITLNGLLGSALATRIVQNHIYTYLPIVADDIPFGSTNVRTASPNEADIITVTKTATSGGNYTITVQGAGNTSPIAVIDDDIAAALSSVFVISGVILPTA